jgi:hypothetical protein
MDKPRLDQGPDYERGFIDGMMYQTQTTVNRAVDAISRPTYYIPSKDQRPWVGLTEEKIKEIWLKGKDHGDDWADVLGLARSFESELKGLNNG